MKLPEKSQALELLEKYCDAYERRDLAAILTILSKNCHIWGTAIDEYRFGVKEMELQLKRDWSQSQHGEIQIVSVVPAPSQSIWVTALCRAIITIDGIKHVFEHLRGTIIINKEAGQWKILHMHASFPDFRNAPNGSFPV